MAKKNISETVRARVLARDGFICRACGFGGSENYAFALECDHIQPESVGGAGTGENLQCLCSACNKSKSDKIAWEFKPRNESVAESVWAVNQRIVKVAFTVGIKEGSVARTLKRLK
jgi:Na+-translocating ferredoxin:NAD+ oxidoreductase RNF subunit RnfB